jgi:hypothetical protein
MGRRIATSPRPTGSDTGKNQKGGSRLSRLLLFPGGVRLKTRPADYLKLHYAGMLGGSAPAPD